MSPSITTFFGIVVLLTLCSSAIIQALASTGPPVVAQSPASQNNNEPGSPSGTTGLSASQNNNEPGSPSGTTGLPNQEVARDPPKEVTPQASPPIFSKILYDDENGHEMGWDPSSVANTFFINDTSITQLSSIVLVNIDQGTPLSLAFCGISGITDGFFEMSCNEPPHEGAQLRYSVFNIGKFQPQALPIQKYFESRTANIENDSKVVPGPYPKFMQEQDISSPSYE